MPRQVIHGDSGGQAPGHTVWPRGCATPLCGQCIWDGQPIRPEPYTSLCSPWEETGPSQDRDQGATGARTLGPFAPNCQPKSTDSARLPGPPAPARSAPWKFSRNIHAEGDVLPKRKGSLSLAPSHFPLTGAQEGSQYAEVKRRPCPNKTSLEATRPWQVSGRNYSLSGLPSWPGMILRAGARDLGCRTTRDQRSSGHGHPSCTASLSSPWAGSPAESSLHPWHPVQGPALCISLSLLPTLSAVSKAVVCSKHLLCVVVCAQLLRKQGSSRFYASLQVVHSLGQSSHAGNRIRGPQGPWGQGGIEIHEESLGDEVMESSLWRRLAGADGHFRGFQDLGGARGEIGKATTLRQDMTQTRTLDVCLC